MKRTLSLFFIVFFAFNAQAITQKKFIERLKNTHPFFNQQQLSTQIRQIEKRATTANEDWIVSLNGHYQNEDASDILNNAYDDLKTTSIDIAATRKIADLGSDITFKHTWTDKNLTASNVFSAQSPSATIPLQSTARNVFSLGYTHPLLRNSGGINDRLNTDVAQIAIEQSTFGRLEQEEGFILEKLKRFIDLAYAQEQLRINKNRLNLASQELDLVKRKFAASVVDKVDVLLQEDAYQSAQQQLLRAQQDLILLRHEIAITLALDFKQIIAKIDLYQPYALENTPLKQQLLKHSRVLKITDLDKKTLKRQLSSFKNQTQAQLDLNLELASAGENTSYANSLENQSQTWRIGLGLSYPLGGIKSNSDVNKAQAQLNQLQQKKQEQLLELHTQATTFKERINLTAQILQSSKKQIKIAQARTNEERQRYANGNGEASFVISAQNNQQNAQLNHAQVAANYQKSVLEYKAILDILQ